MATKTKKRTPRPDRIEVGDAVVLDMASRLSGRVVEDFGKIGREGERILRVIVDLGEGGEGVYEVPETALEREQAGRA